MKPSDTKTKIKGIFVMLLTAILFILCCHNGSHLILNIFHSR